MEPEIEPESESIPELEAEPEEPLELEEEGEELSELEPEAEPEKPEETEPLESKPSPQTQKAQAPGAVKPEETKKNDTPGMDREKFINLFQYLKGLASNLPEEQRNAFKKATPDSEWNTLSIGSKAGRGYSRKSGNGLDESGKNRLLRWPGSGYRQDPLVSGKFGKGSTGSRFNPGY